ncbi:MAG: hypothetical protein NWF00_06460 [Candidatus Bathyarchaeota archaeon]|nr:hypothetical protein [Candidatus Bathyarchaeota archaeon]
MRAKDKERRKRVTACILIALPCIFLFAFIPLNQVQATASGSWVAVSPTMPDSPFYTHVDSKWTFLFKAEWSYGDNTGQAIENAIVTIQVANSKNETIDSLKINTNNGFFSFNYSSPTAEVLTFTPVKLVTEEGVEWNTTVVDKDTGLSGLQTESVVVWWDTFNVALVNFATDDLGTTWVSVNVTYLLLPEEGLTLPESATYSNQTFLPKKVHNENVTINGVPAKETSTAGIYSANVSNLFSPAYVHVEASQENWTKTHTGFSLAHNANRVAWLLGVLVGFAILGGVVAFKVVSTRKTRGLTLFVKHENFPFLGGVLLAVASAVSLYWGLVGVEGVIHGFEWGLLAILGVASFVFGVTGAAMAITRRKQALAISATIAPLITNLVIVQGSLETYELALPWVLMISSFLVAVASGFLISNSDEQFLKTV